MYLRIVVYLQMEDTDGNVHVALVASKTLLSICQSRDLSCVEPICSLC